MKLRFWALLLPALILAVLVFQVAPVLAEQVEITVDGDPPWKLFADEITAYNEQDQYLAKGHVRIVRGEETVLADQARVQAGSQTAELQGNVVMTTKDFKIMCERVAVNYEYNIGKIYDGKIFFPANNYYVSGDEIERTGPDTFVVTRGQATSCDGPTPAWSLTGSNISIKREGFATARNATFSTSFMPVIYMPWLALPLRTKRQSGFLMPSASNSSRDGFTFTQPYYWAISDSKDMTFYLTYMGTRGLEPTVEFRYNDWGGKGTFRATYLHDQDPPTIDYAKPDGPTVQEDRYWIRGMSDGATENGLSWKFDLDLVSDPEYLDEFERSITGYQGTRDQLLAEFGRELAEPLDPLRKSIFQATKSVNNQNLTFALEYTDDLEDAENRNTIQRLPRIDLDLNRQGIQGTPFYFDSNSEYTYFARKTDRYSREKEEGHRLDIHPRIYWPVKLGSYLDVVPSTGYRATVYYPDGAEDTSADPDAADRNNRLDVRGLFDMELETSTNLFRVYDWKLGRMDKLKHSFKPEIKFSYISNDDQDDLPYWDSVDRISEERLLTYGVENYLVAKTLKAPVFPRPRIGDGQGEEDSPNQGPAYQYEDFLRVGVHRSYDFVEAGRELKDRPTGWPSDYNSPHTPWLFEVEAKYSPYFWAQGLSAYNTYSESFTRHSLEFQAKDKRGDYLYMAYELYKEPNRIFDRDKYDYEEVRALLNLALNEEWVMQLDRRYSLKDSANVETIYSLAYSPQCWGIRLEYTDRPDDTSIAAFLTLKGLGEVGSYSYSQNKTEVVNTTNTGN
jgi:LPS-assembly protein